VYPPSEHDWRTGNKGQEKAEVLNNIFASAFTGSLLFHISRVDGSQHREWESKVPHTVCQAQVQDHLRNLNTEVYGTC